MPNDVEDEEATAEGMIYDLILEPETILKTATDILRPACAKLLVVYFPFYRKIHVYTDVRNPNRTSLLEIVSKKSDERRLGSPAYVSKSFFFGWYS